MSRLLIIEDSLTQRHEMVTSAKAHGHEVAEFDRWGYAIGEMSTLGTSDFVIADWNVPDLPQHREQAIDLLIRAKIPFRILTAFIKDVPANLLKYAVEKTDKLGEQVEELLLESKQSGDQQ